MRLYYSPSMHVLGDPRHSIRAAIAAAVIAALLLPGVASADPSAGGDLEPVGTRDAAQQRAESNPTLVALPEPEPHAEIPQDRYAMASGCYTLADASGAWISKPSGGDVYTTTTDPTAAEPFHFQATELGRYLLFDADGAFVARSGGLAADTTPSPDAEWTVDESGTPGSFVFTEGLTVGASTTFSPRLADGCAVWDEIEVRTILNGEFAAVPPPG